MQIKDTIFLSKKHPIYPELWQKYIQFFADKIEQSKSQNWVLYCQDLFLFAVGFLALQKAGKTVILAPNIQTETLKNLSEIAGNILTDIEETGSVLSVLKISKDIDLKGVNKSNLKKINEENEIIFFTSGSSGKPKKITKKLKNLVSEVKSLDQVFAKYFDGNIVFAANVTHQHIYGFLFRFLWPIWRGNPVWTTLISNSEELEQLLKSKKILLITSPSFLKRLDAKNNFIKENLMQIFSSGGLLKNEEAENCRVILGQFPLEILGSTETGGVAWRNQEKDHSWNLLPNVEIKVTDEEYLLVKSPFVNSEDYVVMGDKALLNGSNKFLLKGRIDRIVKIEEKRISLTAIEEKLLDHDYVSSAYALILERKRQLIGVVVQLSEKGQKFLEKSDKLTLNKTLKEHLLQYFELVTLPKKFRYLAEFPLNSQSKIVKTEIEKLFK